MPDRIKIGISACLLGHEVRYDGQGAQARHLTGVFANHFDYHPICPELECGMGVPREAVRLVGSAENPRLVGRQTGRDWTDAMRDWADGILPELEKKRLCGFIFKAKSPTSGFTRIKIYPESGGQPVSYSGVGLFAGMIMKRFPLLPVEDDGRLHDVVLRANFIERVFVEHRWNRMIDQGPAIKRLIEFHTRHKMLIRSHDLTGYHERLHKALALKPTIKKNVDVLMHAMGHFKKVLSPDEKKECLEIIDNYRNEFVPLIVPVTLLNHFVRKYGEAYLREQYYLNPHPMELKLRNHA